MAGTLVIRADADQKIGTGHAMRCLALAQEFCGAGFQVREKHGQDGRATGQRVVWLGECAAEAIVRRIEACGIEFVSLADRHPRPGDVRATLDLLDVFRNDGPGAPVWLVVDGYHFDAEYLAAVHASGVKLLVIDDMAQLDRYDADLVLNQNLGAEAIDYPCDERTTLLLGSRYVLLRREFLSAVGAALRSGPNAAENRAITDSRAATEGGPYSKLLAAGQTERTTPELARRLLVTLGGADPNNLTGIVVRALQAIDVPDLEVRVVLGGCFAGSPSPPATNVQFLRNVDDMPGLMAWADMAISAAGSTAWELAFVGLPAALVVAADNQQPVAEQLAAAGAAMNLGRAELLTPERIAAAVGSLCRDAERRRLHSEAGRRLIDGRGARRVVAIMKVLGGETLPPDGLTLRPIEPGDMRPSWRLANSSSVRRNALSTGPIAWEGYIRWFASRLLAIAENAARIWLLDFHGVLTAVVRYERIERDVGLVSLQVAAPFHRRGLAVTLLESTCRRACEAIGVARLRAIIRQENEASQKTFRRVGFTAVRTSEVKGHTCEVWEWRSEGI